MSTFEQIDHAVEVLGKDDLLLLHACSAYPSQYSDLNLRVIPALRARYGVPVGYSGHETGIASSVAAVALGACFVERHITTDRVALGLGSGGVPGAERHHARRARHPSGGDLDGRRREAGRGRRDPRHAEAAAGWPLTSTSEAVALDVDGVLTDGRSGMTHPAQESKELSFADIMGVSLGRRAGIRFALVSGEGGPLLDAIAAKLGVDDVYPVCKDKAAAVRDFAEHARTRSRPKSAMSATTSTMSPAMDICGLAFAPRAAHPAALAAATRVTGACRRGRRRSRSSRRAP